MTNRYWTPRGVMERARRTFRFWRQQGSRPLLLLVLRKLQASVEGRPLLNPLTPEMLAHSPVAESLTLAPTAAAIESARFSTLQPLRTFRGTSGHPRLTLVTDSIGKGSLFGGVGTALLLAAQTANALNARLRVVTRTEAPLPQAVDALLRVNGVSLAHEPQFQFVNVGDERAELDVQEGELFLTTSWWTTWSTLSGVAASSIVYLLQEDERMFYPHGDDRLRCEQVLSRGDLRYVVNTKLLWNHFVNSGLDNIRTCAVWFEPAFPASIFHRRPRRDPKQKKRLFFYARPHNLRNLFYLGLKVLDAAIDSGVLVADEWEILLVGSHIPEVSFGPDVSVQRIENLDWTEYAELCGSIDLALSLMYTPHPSYPPLDLAASGAVVVTNRFPGKDKLSEYSGNIICADANVPSLVAALGEGVRRVSQGVEEDSGMARDWQETLSRVVQSITSAGH